MWTGAARGRPAPGVPGAPICCQGFLNALCSRRPTHLTPFMALASLPHLREKSGLLDLQELLVLVAPQ